MFSKILQKMRKRLSSKGITLLDAIEWAKTDVKFDLITAFNLLDRSVFGGNCRQTAFEHFSATKKRRASFSHYNPKKLLEDLWNVAHRSKCRVIVSLVLPVSYYVEFHPNGNGTRPDNYLNVPGGTYADQVHYMIANVFVPSGFKVIKWTRLPYLCEGDMNSVSLKNYLLVVSWSPNFWLCLKPFYFTVCLLSPGWYVPSGANWNGFDGHKTSKASRDSQRRSECHPTDVWTKQKRRRGQHWSSDNFHSLHSQRSLKLNNTLKRVAW